MKSYKSKKRAVTAGALALATAGCAVFGFVGCGGKTGRSDSQRVNAMADEFALALMGDDIFNWNAFSVSPQKSFGYVRYGDPSWYFYSEISNADIEQMAELFSTYKSALDKISVSSLSAADAVTYRSLQNIFDTYISYYGSEYAADFDLIGGSYIDSEGGYVALFAQSVENFEIRNERDIKDLIKVAESTKEAFATYDDYAAAREDAGYPLYDYTLTAMQEYLNDVSDAGNGYYLYEIVDKKLDDAAFLAPSVKTTYKSQLRAALDNKFMPAVRKLSTELEQFKGNVTSTEKSYLGGYGNAGRAYYEWSFKQKTGDSTANVTTVYNKLVNEYLDIRDKLDEIDAAVTEAETSDPELFADFSAYINGEKALLGLETPQAILDYLKVAAKKIVPDLETVPTIEFKYMDATVAERTNTAAYYMSTPIDAPSAVEHITINGAAIESGEAGDLLPLLAHEGYPGHLYAYVYAKETGTRLISRLSSCLAFSEGWTQYTALAVLNDIAATSTDPAEALYAEYDALNMYANYISSTLMEMQINYFGKTKAEFVGDGVPAEDAQEMIEAFMESPAVYVPYGYGMYVICDLHKSARATLGDSYDAVEFNTRLLSDGFSPTLERAKEIKKQYVKDKQS